MINARPLAMAIPSAAIYPAGAIKKQVLPHAYLQGAGIYREISIATQLPVW